jgi:hypothetical protein
LAEVGDEGDIATAIGAGQRHAHRGGIDGVGGGGPLRVDRVGHTGGGGEIGIVQEQAERVVAHKRRGISRSTIRAVGDAADRGVIFLHGRAAGATGTAEEAADRDGALRHRVDAAVGSEERVWSRTPPWSDLASPIEATFTSTLEPGFRKGPMSAVSMTAATFLALMSVRAEREAVALEGVGDGAERGGGVAVTIAGETNHEAVADELVVAAAFDQREVFDPGGGEGERREERGREQDF